MASLGEQSHSSSWDPPLHQGDGPIWELNTKHGCAQSLFLAAPDSSLLNDWNKI